MVVFSFLCGSIPVSVWIGRYGLKTDIRSYGDGNPGAFNVMRAGGTAWGMLAVFLDILKAALPVGLAAYIFDFSGLSLVVIASAPPLGHAFSPFLGFKGGKAIAAIGGVWIGLTLAEVAVVMLVMLVFWYTSLRSSAWVVIFTMLSILLYLLLTTSPVVWFGTWVILMMLILYKHWQNLSQLLGLKMSPLLQPLLGSRYSQVLTK